MKNEKGFTLISAIMYLLVATIVIGLIVAISAGVIKSFRVANNDTTKITEMNKINMYMLAEMDNPENKIDVVNADGTYISFTQGGKYTFKDNILYKDTYKVAEGIESVEGTNFFSVDQQNGKTVLTVNLKINGKDEQNSYVSHGLATTNNVDYQQNEKITLLGDNPMTVPNGIYGEPGYSAIDINDNDITDKVEVSSNIVQNRIGTYQVTYTLKDDLGNAIAQKIRTVNITGVLAISDGIGYSGFVPLSPLAGSITMTGYNAWPTGTNLGTMAFGSGVYDSSSKDIWMVPRDADRVVKINTVTGTMTGYNVWPTGFTKGGTAFNGGIGTDTDVWFVPYNADRVVKINKSTGVMTGYGPAGTTATWPTGFTKETAAFVSGTLFGTDMWMAPGRADIVIKVDTLTGNMTGYNSWPTEFVHGNVAFEAAISDGKYIWMIPYDANMIVRLDPTTGNMTGYNSWPTGFNPGTMPFCGATYDGINIWMSPRTANQIVKINIATGAMTGYSVWPAGYSDGGDAFMGAVYDGKTIWMIPYSANMVVGIDATTGVMKGYNAWPIGYTKGTTAFQGAVYDGKSLWMIPMTADRIIKLSGQ